MYGDEKEHKKSKGVVKHKVSRQLSYKTYEETLNRNCKEEVRFKTTRSKNHQIYSINQIKYALNNYDNKRYWYSDVESLPFGHYTIKNLHNEKMVYMSIKSTTEKRSQSMARHRRGCKSYLSKLKHTSPKKTQASLYKSFDELGVENCKMVLVDECPRQNY